MSGPRTSADAASPTGRVGRDSYLAQWSQSHGGHVPVGLTARWLSAVYRLAAPLAAARVRPDAVTVSAVAVAGIVVLAAVPGTRWPVVAALLVAVAGVLDNLDGALAVLSGRVSRWGFVLDSLVDRVVDVLLLVALWRLGGPVACAVAAGSALFLLEFTRSRAGNAGMSEIGVVTVGERPARVATAAGALLTAGVFPAVTAQAGLAGAAVTAALSLAGLAQLLVVVSRTLR